MSSIETVNISSNHEFATQENSLAVCLAFYWNHLCGCANFHSKMIVKWSNTHTIIKGLLLSNVMSMRFVQSEPEKNLLNHSPFDFPLTAN